MAKKTQQALKIIASWTPNKLVAEGMLVTQGNLADLPIHIGSGRLSIHAAVACDFTVPGAAEKASARVQEIKAALESTGTVHSFSATAGAVPVGTAEQVA
jgi:hypothetical protein